MAVKVLLIGLDGATFHILDPLIQQGEMPFLQAFLAEGARADLRTIIPALTPPAWTSLLTGRSPGQHGVFDFFQKERPQSHTIRFTTSQDIHCETLWQIAGAYGLRSIALNFPLCFPPPAIDGYLVPGWMPWRQLRLGCRPADLYDRLKTLPGFNPRELAMDMAHEEKALEGCAPEEYGDWIALHTRREAQWAQILEMLLAEEACDLVTILFDGVDKLQHLFWRFLDPDYADTLVEPWEQAVREACLDYFRSLDAILGRLVAQVGPQATTVIASDHGFGPQVRTFFINAWLAEQGYLHWAQPDETAEGHGQTLGVGQIARHSYLLDWEKTLAYAPLPSGNGIHIVRADADHPHGVSEADYAGFCARLRQELLDLRDPLSGEAVVAEVKLRDEIFAGPYMDNAPDITLVLQDGGLVSILNSTKTIQPRPQPSGTHRPLGVFMAKGPDITCHTQLKELSILQVAPIVLQSLGLPIPVQMEGTLPHSLFTGDIETGQPERRGELDGIDGSESTAGVENAELDEESQAILLSQLRALGYIS